MSPPSSWSKNKPSKKPAWKQVALKMQETFSSETLVDFQRTTRRYIPDDRTLQVLRYSRKQVRKSGRVKEGTKETEKGRTKEDRKSVSVWRGQSRWARLAREPQGGHLFTASQSTLKQKFTSEDDNIIILRGRGPLKRTYLLLSLALLTGIHSWDITCSCGNKTPSWSPAKTAIFLLITQISSHLRCVYPWRPF
jgi:hypothetical protein